MNEKLTWGSILQVSHHDGWQDTYSGAPDDAKVAKSMNTGTTDDKEFWENWCEDDVP